LAGNNNTDSCRQAVRVWKAPAAIVGDKGVAPFVAAWAKARINPLDPGAATPPALSARLRTERLTAWWRKYEAAPNQKLGKSDVLVTQGW